MKVLCRNQVTSKPLVPKKKYMKIHSMPKTRLRRQDEDHANAQALPWPDQRLPWKSGTHSRIIRRRRRTTKKDSSRKNKKDQEKDTIARSWLEWRKARNNPTISPGICICEGTREWGSIKGDRINASVCIGDSPGVGSPKTTLRPYELKGLESSLTREGYKDIRGVRL